MLQGIPDVANEQLVQDECRLYACEAVGHPLLGGIVGFVAVYPVRFCRCGKRRVIDKDHRGLGWLMESDLGQGEEGSFISKVKSWLKR